MNSDWTRGRRGGAPDDRGRDERSHDEGGFRRREDRGGWRDEQQGSRPYQPPRAREDRGDFREGGRPPFRDRPRSFERDDERSAFRDRPRPFEDGDQRPPFRERARAFEGEDQRPPFRDRPREGRDFEDRGERPGRFGRFDDRPFGRDRNDERPTYRQGRGGYRPFDREDRPFARDRQFERGGQPFERRSDDARPAPGGRRWGEDRPAFGGQRRRDEGPPFGGQGRPWDARPDRGAGQFERIQADVYGRWPVLESLRAGNVTRVYLAAGVRETADHLREIQTVAAERQIPVVRVDRLALDRVLGNVNHQGIAAACRPFNYTSFEDILAQAKKAEDQPLLVLFDGVQDPQNLGSILRTAEAIGADGAVLPKHHQAGVTPAVVRASAGAVEHLPVAEVANLRQAIDRLKDAGYWIVGLDMEGGTDYDNFSVDNPIALVIGGEGKGLGRLIADNCDYLVRLPMRGQVGSLNASVAAGIVLYEIDRRRTAADQDRSRRKARKATAQAETDVEAPESPAEEPEEEGDPEHDLAVYTLEGTGQEGPAEAGAGEETAHPGETASESTGESSQEPKEQDQRDTTHE